MILGADVSHYQGAVDFAAVRASGRSFVVLKATEGIGSADPMFAANRRAAHAAGLIVGVYHFARAAAPTSEAAYFLGVVGALQTGEFLVLDWECAYTGDHVVWCKAWLDAVRAATGHPPFIYMNATTMNGHRWAPVAGLYPLWLARYDGTTAAPAVTSWAAAAMKQYSSTAAVPGVTGGCDVNAYYGTADQLAAYGPPDGVDEMSWKDWTVAEKNDFGEWMKAWVIQPKVPDIAAGVLAAEFPKRGPNATGTTSLQQEVGWLPTNLGQLATSIGAVTDVQKLAAAIVDALPAAQAAEVAAQVVNQLGQRINTPPAV